MSRVTGSWSIPVFGVIFAIVLLGTHDSTGGGPSARLRAGSSTRLGAAHHADGRANRAIRRRLARDRPGDGKRRHLRGVGEERRRNSLRDNPIGRPAHRERDGYHGGGKQPGPEVHVAADGHAEIDGADPHAGRRERSSQDVGHGRSERDVRHRGEATGRHPVRPHRDSAAGEAPSRPTRPTSRRSLPTSRRPGGTGEGIHPARRLPHGARRGGSRRDQPGGDRVRRQRPDVRQRAHQLHDGRRGLPRARSDQPHQPLGKHQGRRRLRQAHRVRRQGRRAAHDPAAPGRRDPHQ